MSQEDSENNRSWNLNLRLCAETVLKTLHALLLSLMIPVQSGYNFLPLYAQEAEADSSNIAQ